MKKIILALSFTLVVGLAACGGAGSKIKDYENHLKKSIELANQGKLEESEKEGLKATEIYDEIKKEKLTEEQQRELAKITLKYSSYR